MSEKVTTHARPRFAERRADPVKPWYVYDDTAVLVGGTIITEKDGHRVVLMTENQAKFYLDQGTLGVKPFERLSARATDAVEQATGVSEPSNKRVK